MAKRVSVVAHLSSAELQQTMKTSRQVNERLRFQVIWLLEQGRPSDEVAQTVGYSVAWVRHLAKRYNAHGPQSLRLLPQGNGGKTALLCEEVRAQLEQALAAPVPDELGGGLWNGVKVAAWLSARLGRPVHRQRGQEALRALGFSCQSVRPRHAKAADKEEQEAFKKSWRAA